MVISSNRGLSGPLFGNLVKALEINTLKVNRKSFVSLGKKIDKYINSRNLDLLNNFEMKDEFISEDIAQISNYIVTEFVENQYTSVKLVYSHFNSVANQKAEIIDLLPFKKSEEKHNYSNHIFEPNQLDLISDFAPKYVFIMIYRCILDSLASEHAARMVAMQNATDNANELVDKLNSKNLEGVSFNNVDFIPRFIPSKATYPKFKDKLCKGVRIEVKDKSILDPLHIAIYILDEVYMLHPEEFKFLSNNFIDKLFGSDKLRDYILSDKKVETLMKEWEYDQEKFKEISSKFLLY